MNDAEYLKKLKDFEGYSEHMYLDSKGHVTIGVGIMLPSADKAKSSGLAFTNRDTKKKATADEIVADYDCVKGATKGMWPPSKYKPFTKLDASTASLKKELDNRLKIAADDRKAFYSDFAKLPSTVQYAILDMAYSLGRPKLLKYKKFKAALEKKDWKAAAKESKRNGVQASRNKAIHDWVAKPK